MSHADFDASSLDATSREDRAIAGSSDGNTCVTPEQFKDAFRNHPAGVAVITADAGDGPVAFTATSVCSINVTPPLLAFSISDQSSASRSIRRAETVVVHLLEADHLDLAILCATSGIDRFADTASWNRFSSGEPYFPAATSWIRGRVAHKVETDGASVVIVEALQTGTTRRNPEERSLPLVFHNRNWHKLDEQSKIPR